MVNYQQAGKMYRQVELIQKLGHLIILVAEQLTQPLVQTVLQFLTATVMQAV